METKVKQGASPKYKRHNRFTSRILKSVVGEERARQVLISFSLDNIAPSHSNVSIPPNGKLCSWLMILEAIKKPNSFTNIDLDLLLPAHLKNIQKNDNPRRAKKAEKKGLAEYFDDPDDDGEESEGSDEDEFLFDETDGKNGSKTLSVDSNDVRDLIDFDLVDLLRFCYEM